MRAPLPHLRIACGSFTHGDLIHPRICFNHLFGIQTWQLTFANMRCATGAYTRKSLFQLVIDITGS